MWKKSSFRRGLNMLGNFGLSFTFVLYLTQTPVVYGDERVYKYRPDYKYCPSTFEIDAVKNPTGEIKSPLYGEENYPNSLSCYWHINIPRDWKIKITFKDFDLAPSQYCQRHFLDFYGEGGESLIGVFCGSDIPRPIFSLAGDNVIRIHFNTDEVGSGRGFHLHYETSPDSGVIRDCRSPFQIDAAKNPTGEIKSPLYGEENYPNSLACFWHISIPRDWKIKITFKDLDIKPSRNCDLHYLAFYGEGEESRLGIFCGSDIPGPVFSLRGDNAMRINFRSDEVGSGRGFHIYYEASPDSVGCPENHLECRNRNCVPESKRCDGMDDCGDGTDEEKCNDYDHTKDPNYKYCPSTFEIDATKNPTGEIKSPLYGQENYPNGMSCYWRINIPKQWRIKVTFKDFHLNPSDGCSKDYLDFYGVEGNHVIGVFCGFDVPRPIFSAKKDNVVRIHFKSDEVRSARGFHLYYEASPNLEECPANHIFCKNRNCVPNSKKCDGIDDCEDGTDEQKCGYPVIAPKECGNPAIQPKTVDLSPDRIVGGEEAIPHSWPWQVSLNRYWFEPTSHFCGGTLINSQWVVTAAHCFRGGADPDLYSVHLGMHSKLQKDPGEQIRYPERIIGYPDLESDKLIRHNGVQDDIALIKLNAPVNFTKTIQPACLPSLGWNLPAGTECYATGWGETKGSGFNHALKQTMQIVQSTNDCSHDTKHQICVIHPKHFNSPCHGDSGGPLSCKFGSNWFLMGDLSYATHGNMMGSGLCGMPENKIIYSKVSDKIDWINLVINKFS